MSHLALCAGVGSIVERSCRAGAGPPWLSVLVPGGLIETGTGDGPLEVLNISKADIMRRRRPVATMMGTSDLIKRILSNYQLASLSMPIG